MNVHYPSTLNLYVSGRWLSGDGRVRLPVINPATEEALGELPLATDEDIDAAVGSAASSFLAWRRVPAVERGRILRKAADRIRERREHLAALITLEMGKPIVEARREVETAAEMFDWAAEEARRIYGRVIPARNAGQRQITVWEPAGPVAAFSGWNAAAITPSRKISGALAAGCTIVIKPSEQTPATSLFIARALEEAGLPPGVLNMVFGEPARISERLITSPRIRTVTFTGATSVGKHLAALAAQHMKGMTMELGGHAPVVIFADVDVDAVATAAVAAKYRNAGQVCTSPTRFYVHESVYDRFIARFVEVARGWLVGDGMDENAQMGPLANARRLEAMARLTDDARDRGIRVAAGGARIGNRGWFWKPTVLVDAGSECLAANIEPFGPIALMERFATFDDAARLANRLPFGLAAYAFTRDARTATEIAGAFESGTVAVNHWQVSLPETPFGGFNDSGFGKEGGIEGLQAFQKLKYISQA